MSSSHVSRIAGLYTTKATIYWALGEADEVFAYTSLYKSTRAANERFGTEDMDQWLEYAVDQEETE